MPGSSDSLAFLGIYNSAKELLVAYSNMMRPRAITMPQNTAYIRASLRKESSARLSTIDGETIFAWNAIGQAYNNDNIIPDNDYEVMPEDWPHEVGYRRSQQLTDIKWTPKNNVPRVIHYGGDPKWYLYACDDRLLDVITFQNAYLKKYAQVHTQVPELIFP